MGSLLYVNLAEAVESWVTCVKDQHCACAWIKPAFPFFRLPTQQSDSPSHCQRGQSPASSEEQRRRARQHLDDITAARLLPLHHLPAQLLSIEESLALQREQKQNYEVILESWVFLACVLTAALGIRIYFD
jgi:hypothetical protein